MSTFTPLPCRSNFLRNPPVTRISDLPPGCKQNGDCGICWTPLTEDCDPVVLHGIHVFCKDCIIPWLEQQQLCPYCRQDVFSALSSRTQHIQWSVNRFLAVDTKDVADDCLIFDADVLRTTYILHKQYRGVRLLIETTRKETITPSLLADRYAEEERLRRYILTLKAWRGKMYQQAPGNMLWSIYNFPRSEARLTLRGDTHTYLRVHMAQTHTAIEKARSADSKRYWLLEPRATDPSEPVAQPIQHHPLLCPLIKALLDATHELDGTRQTAGKFHAALKQRVDERLKVVMERALRGEQEAIVMKRFVGTLVTKVVEAQTLCKI
ncbi:hypothetical protein LTR95_011150 [Oleoguttula sp. CCFEE 5521]